MAERTRTERLYHPLAPFRRAEMLEERGPGGDGDLIERVLDVDHQATGVAQRGTDPVDVGHDFACRGDLGYLARSHEAILQVDHNMCSSLWI